MMMMIVGGAIMSVAWVTNRQNENHLRLDGVTIHKSRNTSNVILSIFYVLTYILKFYLKFNFLYIYKLIYFDFMYDYM